MPRKRGQPERVRESEREWDAAIARTEAEGAVAHEPKALDKGLPLNLRDAIWIGGILITITVSYFKGQMDTDAKIQAARDQARLVAREEVTQANGRILDRLDDLKGDVADLQTQLRRATTQRRDR